MPSMHRLPRPDHAESTSPSDIPAALRRAGGPSGIVWVTSAHNALGRVRRFGVYKPLGYRPDGRRYPVLYLFRGQETEWAGRQDGRPGLVSILDRLIATGRIHPLLVVLPGFMPADGMTQGVPVNWSDVSNHPDVGTGRFEDYFFDIKSWVETHLPAKVGVTSTALDGFSMGGFASLLLATRHPHRFGSVGAYDGSFMWTEQLDPRRKPRRRADPLWFSETCAPLFRRPDGRWDRVKMERHNPTRLILTATPRVLHGLRATKYHIRSAGSEAVGNVDRMHHLLDAMHRRGLENSFAGLELVLHPTARHDWRWADRHLQETLVLHDQVFRAPPRTLWSGGVTA